MERVVGIEPTLSAWEAEVLPLNYTRVAGHLSPLPELIKVTYANPPRGECDRRILTNALATHQYLAL